MLGCAETATVSYLVAKENALQIRSERALTNHFGNSTRIRLTVEPLG
jgi:hypothetical protein